ncbi:MAG: glycosyltransferase family 4 protein [Anaerolineae bacterium]|nr:glycosyltransferase family 4 protein [Anaerolineae bacterium]
MRVVIVSKALVVGIYQRKLECIARLGVDLLALVPPSWHDERGEIPLERAYTDGYRLETLPIRRNGDYHLHSYDGLGAAIRRFQPEIVHIDEEPYNLAAWQSLWHARRAHAKTLLFSWQNILRRYPPPFNWGERWMLNSVDYLIAGTESAADVWRAKGYRGRLAVIAQFGVDPDLFHPPESTPDRPFTIGCVARLVPEKGLIVLLHAVAQLGGDWRLRIVGGGPLLADLQSLASLLGIADQVAFLNQIPSTEMPAQYHEFDVLAVPSLTMPNWKEQFGPRATVEAMASRVPVVGSDSGAIPNVIGDAGMIVPEGDVDALAAALYLLRNSPEMRAQLGWQGRVRVLTYYTHAGVAEATVEVYNELLGQKTPPASAEAGGSEAELTGTD